MRKPLALMTMGLLVASAAWADSLELKNGSLIKGKYMGGDETTVTFQVGTSTQRYNVADIKMLTFEPLPVPVAKVAPATAAPVAKPPATPTRIKLTPEPSDTSGAVEQASLKSAASTRFVTIPAGTYLNVRTIDAIDSEKNQIGDRFQATLQEPLMLDGVVIAPRGTDVYGRLSQAKDAGKLSGTPELRLELVEMVLNQQRIPLVTGEYELKGDSRTAGTAKKAAGGAALGAIIGAIAGGGKGAAIGAGVGAGAGTTIQVMTKGDKVNVPSETLLEFRLEQPLTINNK
ncbi:MAG TPA: hypothetical protein VN577_03345 [Terriglobales bacterium]|nr:hypothetical protein [Terriglobales bacterium]